MEEELNITDYINKIKENWIAATTAFIIIFALVLIYTFMTKPVYEAKSSVIVSTQDQSVILSGITMPKIDLETQRQIILSPVLLAEAYPIDAPKNFKITATAVKNSNVIDITVQSDNGETAASVANGLANAYLNYTSWARQTEASELLNFINSQIEEYAAEIDELTEQSIKYKNMKNLTVGEQLDQQTVQREINSKTKIYDYLQSKKEETYLAAKQKSTTAKIISEANAPEAPVSPNIPLNILIGLVLAGAGAIGAVLLIEQMKEDEGMNTTQKKRKF